MRQTRILERKSLSSVSDDMFKSGKNWKSTTNDFGDGLSVTIFYNSENSKYCISRNPLDYDDALRWHNVIYIIRAKMAQHGFSFDQSLLIHSE